MQAALSTFGYPAHPPGIGRIAAQLMQHPIRLRYAKAGETFRINVSAEDFLLYDRDKEIRYLTPEGELVHKVGTIVVPVKHYSVIYAEDIYIGEESGREAWNTWKITPDGTVTATKTIKSSRPGTLIHSAWSYDAQGGRLHTWVSISAYESEFMRSGIRYDSKQHREVLRKGWAHDPEMPGRAIEIRRPGDTKGYTVLEERA